MDRLLRDIQRLHGGGYTVADWTAATEEAFGRFLRKKSVVTRDVEVFATELPNLVRLLNEPPYLSLFEKLLKGFRVALLRNRSGTFGVLHRFWRTNLEAESAYTTMYHNIDSPVRSMSARNQVARIFLILDSLVEGCYRLRFISLYGLAKLVMEGTIPQDLENKDFGTLVRDFPTQIRNEFSLILQDPVVGVATNQWRNIAAHKSFRMISSDKIEIEYGKNTRHTAQLSLDQLWEVFEWALCSYNALRLAEVVAFLEYRDEIVNIGPLSAEFGLESQLVGITNNIHIAGFDVASITEASGELTIFLEPRSAVPCAEASGYLMQILAPLARAISIDITRRDSIARVSAVLIAEDVNLAKASVQISDAMDYLEMRTEFEEYCGKIHTEFFPGFKL